MRPATTSGTDGADQLPTPVLLDADIGTDVDDAIALALLLASRELDLRAITCVSGDARLRALIAGRMLQSADRLYVSVAAGVRDRSNRSAIAPVARYDPKNRTPTTGPIAITSGFAPPSTSLG